ncbi:MAG: hypothetical protein WDA29_11010 [Flavobacteriaceae bacterium]
MNKSEQAKQVVKMMLFWTGSVVIGALAGLAMTVFLVGSFEVIYSAFRGVKFAISDDTVEKIVLGGFLLGAFLGFVTYRVATMTEEEARQIIENHRSS